MAFTIRIILRAVCFVGVSTAYFVTSLEASVAWQSIQFMLREAAIKPIVPMNSSTVSPRRTWMFLKTSSAIWGFSCGAAWPFAGAFASREMTAIALAPTVTRLELNLMSPSLLAAHEGHASPSHQRIIRIKTDPTHSPPHPPISYHLLLSPHKTPP